MESFDNYLVIPPTELRKLTAQRKEFGTLESLCIDLCGGVTSGGRMLYRLLQWWTKASHPEGWVWKSHVDWYAELRITQKELPKANGALKLAGVEIRRLKGHLTAPCNHYRLNADQFVAALSRRLGLGIEWLKNFCADFVKSIAPKERNRNAQKSAIEMPKSGTSSAIGTADFSSLLPQVLNSNINGAGADSKENSAASAFVDESAQEGASSFEENARHGADDPNPPVPATPLPREVQQLVDYAIESKRLPLECAYEYLRKHGELRCVEAAKYALGPSIDKPAGMFRWVLDQTDWFMNTLKPAPVPAEYPGKTDEIYDKSDDDDDVTEIEPQPYIDPERVAQWRSAFMQLELQLDKPSFDMWLRDTQLVGFEDETFIIGVRNKYAVDTLTYRLNRSVKRVLEDVVGAPVQMRFEVYTPRQRHEDKEMPLYQLVQS